MYFQTNIESNAQANNIYEIKNNNLNWQNIKICTSNKYKLLL